MSKAGMGKLAQELVEALGDFIKAKTSSTHIAGALGGVMAAEILELERRAVEKATQRLVSALMQWQDAH